MDHEGEELIYDIIRGEGRLAGGEPCAGEDDHREDDHREDDDHRENDVDEDEISSFLNASGDGQDLEQMDEGQTNNADDGPSTTTGEVYIY